PLMSLKSILLLTLVGIFFVSIQAENCDIGPCSLDIYLSKYLERSEHMRAYREAIARARAANAAKAERTAFGPITSEEDFGYRHKFTRDQSKFARQPAKFAMNSNGDVATFDVDMNH
ncbi:hypothetical protein PFISCL1PPCAC_2189, partial [Pristionchus fissidentatus]